MFTKKLHLKILGWVLNTPLSITLGLEKKLKLNLGTSNGQPDPSLRRPLKVLKTPKNACQNTSPGVYFGASLRGQMVTSAGWPNNVFRGRWMRFLGKFRGPIFAGWVITCKH